MTFATLMLALIASSPAAEAQAKPTILDFTMAGCGPCQQMRPALELLKEKGYPVVVVDRDRSPERCQRYGVTAFPTFIIVDPRGRKLAETQGLQPAGKLASLYNEALAQLAESRAEAEDDVAPADDAPPEAEEGVAEADEAPRPKAPHPWETVVRIKVHGPNSIGFGSGTIIASSPDESIILTCAHIFHIEGARQQPLPKEFSRRIDIDLFDGNLAGPNRQTVHPIQTVSGKAIDYDFVHDVGLISIRPGTRLAASPVVSKGFQPKVGDRLTTVGCSEGHDATAWSTKVVSPRTGGPSKGYSGTLCLSAPKQGRSGGGLYTESGQVVGVCDFADYQGDRGFYASPESIHGILARNKMQDLFLPGGDPSRMLASRSRGNVRPAGERLTVRAQNEDSDDALSRPRPKTITVPPPDRLGIDTPSLASADRDRSRTWGAPAARPASPSQRSRIQDAEIEMAPSVVGDEPSEDVAVEAPAPRPKVVARGQWKAARREDVARRTIADEEN